MVPDGFSRAIDLGAAVVTAEGGAMIVVTAEGGAMIDVPAPVTADDGGSREDRLVTLWETARGRKARDRERGKFLEAVGEARRAGATDELIAHGIRRRAVGAPWDGPNAAREKARAVLADWHDEIGRDPKRKTVGAILADVEFSAKYLGGGATGRDGRPVRIEPAGRARCEGVLAWAEEHAKTLIEARQWPDERARQTMGEARP